MLQRQERFLDGLRKHGTVRKACSLVPIDRETVRVWRRDDIFNFVQREKDAHDEWVDSQEELLNVYNEGIKPGQTPIGLLASLTANRPEKWNRATKFQFEAPNELIKQLRQLQDLSNVSLVDSNKKPEALNEADSSKIVEGESRLVDGKPLPWEE